MSVVIGVRTENEVVLASDSKVTVAADVPQNFGLFRKIWNSKNLFFSTVGIIRDSKGLFDVSTIMESADAPTVPERITEFERIVREPLLKVVEVLKSTQPGEYRLYSQNSLLQIAFASFEDKPRLHFRSFSVVKNGDADDLKIEVAEYSEGTGQITFGSKWVIDGFIRDNPSVFREGWRPAIDKLISLQAQADPEHVAMPAHIIHISALGPHWL